MSSVSERKHIPNRLYKRIFSVVPRLCVDLLIIENDCILLTKRRDNPGKGYWHIPGGRVIYGERLREAIKRKASEEINIEVEKSNLVHIHEYPLKYSVGHDISLCYLVKSKGSIKETSNMKFFSRRPKELFPTQDQIISRIKLNNNVLKNFK